MAFRIDIRKFLQKRIDLLNLGTRAVERIRPAAQRIGRAIDIRRPLEITPKLRAKLRARRYATESYLGENIGRGIGRFIRTGAERVTEPLISRLKPKYQPTLGPVIRGVRQAALGFIPGPIPMQEELIGRKLTEPEKLMAVLPIGGFKGRVGITKELQPLAKKSLASKGIKEFVESIGKKGAEQIKKSFGGSTKQFFKEATKPIAPVLKPRVITPEVFKDTKEFGFQGRGLKEVVRDMPLDDIPKRSVTTPEYREYDVNLKAGRKITKPLIATVKDITDPNSPIEIVDGWHRWRQAVANKDKTIPVKFIFQEKPQVARGITKKPVIKPATKIERGFVTSVKEKFPGVKAAGQYIPRDTDDLAIRARSFVISDPVAAERLALTGTDDKAVATATELIKHYGDEATRATNPAIRDTLSDKAAEVANTVARNLTESGRSVQAASILGRLTPEGQLRFAAKEIQMYNAAIEKSRFGLLGLRKKIPELTGDQANKILTEMKAIEVMPEGTEKAIRFKKLQDSISDLVPTPLYKKVIAVWKAGLLTGLKTSGLNIFSNVSHTGTEVLKDLPATVVDRVAALFTGKRTLATTMRGMGEGIREGFEKGWQYMRTGYSDRDIGIKLDYRRVNFGKGKIAKGLQKYEETIFRLMGAEDQPFYYGAKARSLYSQAIAKADNAGLKDLAKQSFIDNLVENPTDVMARYAVLDAETAVFQNPTTLGRIAKAIQKAPGGEVVVPFGRTPSAVATQILNYSPVGIVNTIINNIGTGRFDQRLFSQGIGRGITGTAALFIGTALFKRGLIALDMPTGERERKLWELEGKKPNSIKIGDKYRSLQVLGPAGNVILVGAHFQNAFDNSGSPTEAMTTALAGSAKSFSEQTFLTGINRTVEALVDPQRSAEGYLGSTLASTIPTILSDVARALDPFERRAGTITQRFAARMPILRQKLEPQITVLGKERKRVGGVLETMIDPTRPSEEIITPITMELRRLWNQGYKVSPTLLGDKKGYAVLTQAQNTDLWKRAGEMTESKLGGLIEMDRYWGLEDDLKAKSVEGIVDKAKMYARVEKVLEVTQGLTGEALLRKLSELKEGGLLTREVFEAYQLLR